ncbi:DUF7802 domain-containing protein [Marmoricola sp. RAF53]|uniref:DUF7802 domain-containing protein n=1 Tax=Marmoricola sp. RAF53 TaxID=3233059 RepID=UPI003F996488
MSANCDRAAERITDALGFDCHGAHAVVTIRDPFDLASWTQPVLELLIVVGAVLALLHAIRRHRDGDPTNLALWFGSLVYLFLVEPLLYFPEWFGIKDYVGFNFAHNVFTVQFMYDRLPLYIVAFYPAMSQLAYELVRRFGVFVRRGALAGGVCVAFVYQVFYEIFDQLGPQLRWWAWNLDNPDNHPLFASVPMNSIWIFASVTFGVMTFLLHRLVGAPTGRGAAPRGRSLVWRVVVVGLGSAVAMPVFAATTAVFGREHANVSAKAVVLTVEIVALWVAGTALLWREWRAGRPSSGAHEPRTPFSWFPLAYLVVLGVLWVGSLPAFLDAVDGRTDDGTMTGNLPYVLACFVAATLVLVGSRTLTASPATEDTTPSSRPAGPDRGPSAPARDLRP